MEEKKSTGNKAVIILLILLLLGSLAANFYLYKGDTTKEIVIQEKETVIDSLVDARVNIETELNTTLAELDTYRGKNAALDSLLNEAEQKLKQRQSYINKLVKDGKGDDKLIAQLRKELEEVRALRDQYLDKIDELTEENEKLKTELVMVTTKSDSLATELKNAGALDIEYVKVKSFKLRYNGKPVETAKASRTEKIEVCFSIMDNKYAQAAEHTVHLRIMQPDAVVLGEKGKFVVKGNGVETGYTATETFNYDKNKKDFCFDFTDEKYRFPKGTYMVDIFVDGNLQTSGYYDLK